MKETDKIIEVLHDMKCRSKLFPLREVAEKINALYSAGEEVYVECEAEEAEHTLIRPKLPLHVDGYVKKLTRPTVSEEEIDEVIHASYHICVLQERITFYYANRPTLVDEISKLQTRQRKAIKELLNR